MGVLCKQDLMRIDAERARDIRITLVEGLQLPGSFDVRLHEYAARKLHKQGVYLVKVSRAAPAPTQSHALTSCRPESSGVPVGQGR